VILVFDTETTGLPDFRAPSDAPQQPHIVQFAAVMMEDDGTERCAVNLLVRPDGWTIPAEVSAIHGITEADATLYGVPESLIVSLFLDLVGRSDITCAAHNEGFDWRIMRIAMLRSGMDRTDVERIEGARRVCTMRMADKIMKLPPTAKMMAAGFAKSKPPSLTECMKHFFDDPHDKAHDAMADVRACARILIHMSAMEKAA
jgi:DNA polymerase-3 subunit epsilon